MKNLIFCMLLTIISLSVHAIDVGNTPPDPAVQCEVSIVPDQAAVPAAFVVEAPSVEVVGVNVLYITYDMMPACADEVMSTSSVPAPKLIDCLFAKNTMGYRANIMAPPNYMCRRSQYNGNSRPVHYTKLN